MNADGPLVEGHWPPAAHDPLQQRLWLTYGARAEAVLRLIAATPSLGTALCPHMLETAAQAVFAVQAEGA